MPTALQRGTGGSAGGWYHCFADPEIVHLPNLAISSVDLTIRTGDLVMLSAAGSHSTQFVTAACANAASVANTTRVLGWALADLVYNGTTIAANSTQLPVLVANDWTRVRMAVNSNNVAVNTADTVWYLGKLLTVSRAAASAVTDDAYYYGNLTAGTINSELPINTNAVLSITAWDRQSWPSFPTNGASDAYLTVWTKVLPARRSNY